MIQYTAKTTGKSNAERIYSLALSDRTLLHSIQLPNSRTSLLVTKGGKSSLSDQYIDPTTEAVYKPANDAYLRKGMTIVPSGADGDCSPNELLVDIQLFLHKYLDLDLGFEEITGRYVLLSYLCDKFDKLPYLRVLGTYGTGKSRFLNVIGAIVHLPINLGAAVTNANMFRMVDRVQMGCLLMDEANFPNSGPYNHIVQMLNNGFQRNGMITRCVGKKYEPVAYSTFGPKIVAAHVPFSDPGLESRFFTQVMTVTKRSDLPMSIPPWNAWPEAEQLRKRLLNFRINYFEKTKTNLEISQLARFDRRLQEIAAPLFQVTGDEEISDPVMAFLKNHENALVNINRATDDGIVAKAILSMARNGASAVLFKDLVEEVKADQEVILSGKIIGNIVRTMGFATRHTNKGMIVHLDVTILRNLALRYGDQTKVDSLEVQDDRISY